MADQVTPQQKQDDLIIQRQKDLERKKFLEQEKAKNEDLLRRLEQMAQNTKEKKQYTDPMKNLVIDIEKDLLYQIMLHLKQRKISKEQAQRLAKDFLALLPFQDQKDMLDKLYKLGEHNIEVKEVYLKYAEPYFEEERIKKLQMMTEHIKTGNIEQAIAIAKGGNE
ncbi:MAG TPA: hypothetical protein VLF89_09430 [Candidatus Saccharimonadales bacterium]|nr:hypothetical protein [Candidatus Saccharimonadales bacterium]